MKLATVLFASTAVLLGIAACATPAPEENEEIGSTSQALCMKGMICQPTKTSGFYFGGSSGLVLDPGTSTSSSGGSSGSTTPTISCGVGSGQTFECKGPAVYCNSDGTIYKTTTEPCDMTVRCETVNGAERCDCVPGCSGGSYSFGGWNPCMYGQTYSCIGTYCRCN